MLCSLTFRGTTGDLSRIKKPSDYKIFRKDRQESKGGVEIFVANSISSQKISLQDPQTTPLLITLKHNPDPNNIANLYSSPETDISNSLPLLHYLEKYLILIETFNTR